MIRIGFDAYGGDNGDIEVIKAIATSLGKFNDIKYVIFGDENSITSKFASFNVKLDKEQIEIVNSIEKIEMNDHPVFALRSKPNSSIFLAGQALINNKIDIFISAGNTGALVALAQFYLKPIDGVDRPVVAAIVPTKNKPLLIIDSGCNVDSKASWLLQYAKLGNEYYKVMFNEERPRIGLLSVGTEENKGNTLTLETYNLIKETNLNFVGNVEARDLPFCICDVIVTDGFAGNVFLKTYEGTAKMLLSEIKNSILSSLVSKIGGLLIKNSLKPMLKKYDAKIYGGAPILGAKYLVLKCHGNATNIEYEYAIEQARNLINKNIISNIHKKFEV